MATIASLVVALRAETTQYNKKLNKSKKNTRSLGQEIKKVSKVGAAAFATMGGAGVVALVSLTSKSFETVDALAKTADQLNVTTKALAGLQLAAVIGGESEAKLDIAMKKMQRSIGEAALGAGQGQIAFKKLGIEIESFKNLDADKQFAIIGDKLKEVDNAATRAAYSGYIFGRLGQNLLNTLLSGSDALEKFKDQAEKLGIAVSRVDAAKIEAANDSMAIAGKVTEGLGNRIAVKFAPVIKGLADKFTEAALANNGFKDAVDFGFRAIVSIVSHTLNVFNGLVIIAKTIKVGWLGMLSTLASALIGFSDTIAIVFNAVLTPMRAAINLVFTGAQKLVGLLGRISDSYKPLAEEIQNSIEGIKSSVESNLTFDGDQFRKGFSTIQDAFIESKNDLDEIIATPPPSIGFKAWVDNVEQEAERAAKAVAKAAGGGGTGEADQAAIAEKLSRDLEQVRQFLLTREEVEIEAFERRKAIVEQAVTDKEQRDLVLEQLELKHQESLSKIHEEAARKRARADELEARTRVQAIQGMLGNLISLQTAGSKKLFKISQAAAVAQTIVNTYAAAQRAMAEISFPLNLAVAASAIVAGLGRVQQIKSTSFGSSSISASSSSSASASTAGTPNFSTPDPVQESVEEQEVPVARTTIIIQGDVIGNDGRRTVEQIRELLNDEDMELISPTSRNGQDLLAAVNG